MRAQLVMTPHLADAVFDDELRDRLRGAVEIDVDRVVSDPRELGTEELAAVDVLLTGWGAAPIDDRLLDAMPALRAIVHWGGGVGFISPSVGTRGIAVSTGREANAVPVAEWTVAMIVLAAKDAFWMSRRYAAERRALDREELMPRSGLFRTAVGIVGASSVGRLVIERLRSYDVDVLLYDPFVTPEDAAAMGVELVADLAALAARVTLLSVHAPETPATVGMISRAVLAALPDGATLINTARGALVDQDALVAELRAGRLRAVLDVTEPDVLAPEHPLFDLPNVFLTPHLAGSTGVELRRLGASAVAEVERFARGIPFAHPIEP